MVLNLLFSEPLVFLAWLVAMVMAISLHEFFHAFAAYLQGDPTAKNVGRLTLNPLRHLDLWGTVMLLLAGFGWGKPVPYNPYNLKNQRWGPALVALAGPAANLFLILVCGFILRLLVTYSVLPSSNMLFTLLELIVVLNTVWLTFNLIPIPPLDGSKLLFAILPERYNHFKFFLLTRGPFLLMGLIILDSLIGGISILNLLFSSVLYLVSRIIGIT